MFAYYKTAKNDCEQLRSLQQDILATPSPPTLPIDKNQRQISTTRINKMPGATISAVNIRIDEAKLMEDIHHTAQFGIGERWGE
jgi:hypothetical protein